MLQCIHHRLRWKFAAANSVVPQGRNYNGYCASVSLWHSRATTLNQQTVGCYERLMLTPDRKDMSCRFVRHQATNERTRVVSRQAV